MTHFVSLLSKIINYFCKNFSGFFEECCVVGKGWCARIRALGNWLCETRACLFTVYNAYNIFPTHFRFLSFLTAKQCCGSGSDIFSRIRIQICTQLTSLLPHPFSPLSSSLTPQSLLPHPPPPTPLNPLVPNP